MFVNTIPGAMEGAGGALAGIGASVVGTNAGAGPGINGVVSPSTEPTGFLLETAFQTHAAMFQALQAEAAAIHADFVATMGTSALSYAASEVFNGLALG